MRFTVPFAAALVLVFFSCTARRAPEKPPVDSITAERIKQHIEVLSADGMEGRGPGTEGAKKARDYIIEALKAAGAAPLHQSWTQPVPLRRIENTERHLAFKGANIDWTLTAVDDFVLENSRGPGTHAATGEAIFVGFGVEAPEYEWNDYVGIDCKGKVLVMFVGDPPTEDQTLFGGKAMTYYGRWTYKLEKALDMGAAGCLIIHRPDWAAYPWMVVQSSWAGRHADTRSADDDQNLAFGGWIQWSAAEKLVQAAGHDLDELAAAASKPGFKPIPLGVTVTGGVTTAVSEYGDENILGVFRGRKDEWVIYTAHYDHLGVKDDAKPGQDAIYNGARDNASGCASVLAIAEAFGALKGNHERSVMMLFVCAEEQGLLGSRYWVEKPLIPLARTAANINIDGINVNEATTDMQVVGSGQSDLEDVLVGVLKGAERILIPDQESEKGFYYRSDHFNFAKAGVPALYTKTGDMVPGREPNYMVDLKKAWTAQHYHQPSDEFDPTWPCAGAAADARVLFEVGLRIANQASWPAWRPTSEFRAAGEARMQKK